MRQTLKTGFVVLVIAAVTTSGLALAQTDDQTSETAEPDATGFIFPCGDIPALAQILETMSRDPHEVRKMGVNAVEKVENHSTDGIICILL